ncbi:MAG TPA: hypothetical protein VM324_12615 [Egibacteraceae bacterium]|nr:hypothetical protein [Egibacteraceae bacterium]
MVLNGLGHFEPAELEEFWQFAAQYLVPAARRQESAQWAVVGPRQVTEAATAVGLEASGQNLDWSMFSFRQAR